ncbi:MAG: hypothetical protein ACRDSE_19215 [Pseudonocardiaceae bacterium]
MEFQQVVGGANEAPRALHRVEIELARYFGHPTVVFAPTTMIQQQWLETVGLFTESAVESVASDDPARIAPLGVFTYQVIATQDHADGDFRDAARSFRIS